MKNRILQLKKIACAAGIALLVAGNAQAGIVTFTAATPGSVNVTGGTAIFTTPADDSVVTSLMYDVSVLDLDGDGLDDQFTVTAPFSGFGGTGNNNINFDSSSVNELDHDGTVFGVNDGISYGAITISGTSSTGLAYQLNSALYQEFSFRRFNGDPEGATIVGDVTNVSASVPGGPNNPAIALNDTVFDVTATAGSFNVNNIDFTVDVSTVAIPEPSSLAILAAGMGLFVARRRRNK